MKYSLPELSYGLGALSPHLSAETLECHWGKHHRGYVDALNRLVQVDYGNGNWVKWSYDAFDRRVKQHDNDGTSTVTRDLIWEGLSLIESRQSTGELRRSRSRLKVQRAGNCSVPMIVAAFSDRYEVS